jgi:hypothetical protein
MTLTTHGTEYFRDPELVRMAMAGRRVNEVEAQRFDLYSVGAVLYFVTQGTFPSMGPLSRYGRPVPYAVTAIANRAMSDYEKRYTTAAEMIADLDHLLRARRLDRVSAARLPSFRKRTGPAPAPVPTAKVVQPRARSGCVAALAKLILVVLVIGTIVAGGLFALRLDQPHSSTSERSAPLQRHHPEPREQPRPERRSRFAEGRELLAARLAGTPQARDLEAANVLLLDARGEEPRIAFQLPGATADDVAEQIGPSRADLAPVEEYLRAPVDLQRVLAWQAQARPAGEILVLVTRFVAGLERFDVAYRGTLASDLVGSCDFRDDLVREARELLSRRAPRPQRATLRASRALVVGRLLEGGGDEVLAPARIREAFAARDPEALQREVHLLHAEPHPPLVMATVLETDAGLRVIKVQAYHQGILVEFYRDSTGFPVPDLVVRDAHPLPVSY